MPNFNRREFITVSSLAAAALLSPTSALLGASGPKRKRTHPLGIQLYSVRGELSRDLQATLQAVARMGYDNVEFYAPYYTWAVSYAKEVRTMLDDLGLKAYSTHNHIESFTPGAGIQKAIELNRALGARHLVLASAPNTIKTSEEWSGLCRQLTTATATLRSEGMTGGFHNHASEWAEIGAGQRVMDLIARETPEDFVLQFDVGTCMEAGADPLAWVKANPGRIKSVHLKDWAPGSAADEKGFRVLFSEGTTPWKELLTVLERVGGVEFYLMEQEGSRFDELETAKRCIQNWDTLRGEG